MTKYQVFISSTFLDLKDERQAAVQAILTTHNIPAGMELFSAGNESQLTVIKNWIKDSDIYMLLLGGRYGAIDPVTGLSYTQIEYKYALELGKPVFALIISDTYLREKVHLHGAEEMMELANRPKYELFKGEVSSRMCVWFNNLTEIKLATINSLNDIIGSGKYKLQGWVKAELQKNVKKPEYPVAPFSFGLKIVTPNSGELLPNPVAISGTFTKMPPQGIFYCIEYNPLLGTYWPKNEIYFDDTTKIWRSVMSMGRGDNLDRVMIVIAVGDFGFQAINDFYLTPMNRGLNDLTYDMITIDQVRIKLRREI